jgi:predicted dehydrogenase
LTHGHARGFFTRNLKRTDVQLVGVSEPDAELRARYFEDYKTDAKLGYPSLDAMLDATKPQAVLGFSNTFDHLGLVETCASRKVPVMVEKPLAVSNEHAERIRRASQKSGIPVLVNYETTWYASNAAAQGILKEGQIGEARKIVVQDGHQGPKEIGVGPEFLSWLTDPKLNGAGALFDFGCYGANLITWLLNNQRPVSVTALAQTIKPDLYSKVDDDATILLEYPKTQGIIEASWNWPFSRKDMEVYGRTGYVHTVGPAGLRVRLPNGREQSSTAPKLSAPHDDFLSYFAAVVRGDLTPTGLSSLDNNLIVTAILDAARQSAKSGRTVRISKG